MSLNLKSEEIHALSTASTVLLTPFAHETANAWQHAACEAVQRALGGDAAALAITRSGATTFGGLPETVKAMEIILPLPEWVKKGLASDRPNSQQKIANWNELYDEATVRRSSFYNDAVRPIRLLAPITMMEGVIPGQLPVSLMVYFRDEQLAAKHVAARREKLQLLFPAFCAGIRAYLILARAGQDAVALAENVADGVAIYDLKGRLIYENPSLGRIVGPDAERERIRREIVGLATNLASNYAKNMVRSPPRRLSVAIDTNVGHYNASAVFFEDAWSSIGPVVVVLLTARNPHSICFEEVKSRYRLSDREIEITQLLTRGYSSKQIAAVFGISVNTVRRHTENILAKLGVHSRAGVSAKLANY